MMVGGWRIIDRLLLRAQSQLRLSSRPRIDTFLFIAVIVIDIFIVIANIKSKIDLRECQRQRSIFLILR